MSMETQNRLWMKGVLSDDVIIYPSTTCVLSFRLLIGSLIAKEFRDALRDEVGLSSSAGIAHNKVLAKLVGSTHKPNDQTILPKTQTDNLMLSLKSIRY